MVQSGYQLDTVIPTLERMANENLRHIYKRLSSLCESFWAHLASKFPKNGIDSEHFLFRGIEGYKKNVEFFIEKYPPGGGFQPMSFGRKI